jgi:hypothetical protein
MSNPPPLPEDYGVRHIGLVENAEAFFDNAKAG